MLGRLDDHRLGISVYGLACPATEKVLESIRPGLDGAANPGNLLSGQRHVQRVVVHEGDPSPVLEALDGIPCTGKGPSKRQPRCCQTVEHDTAAKPSPQQDASTAYQPVKGPQGNDKFLFLTAMCDQRSRPSSCLALTWGSRHGERFLGCKHSQSSTCAQDALASCPSAPMQYCAAREVPAQSQQPRISKQLLLITWQGMKASKDAPMITQ